MYNKALSKDLVFPQTFCKTNIKERVSCPNRVIELISEFT